MPGEEMGANGEKATRRARVEVKTGNVRGVCIFSAAAVLIPPSLIMFIYVLNVHILKTA